MDAHVAIAYLSVGSNMPDGAVRVADAMAWIDRSFGIVGCSSVYTTDSISGDGTVYFNAVASVETEMSAEQLTAELKRYETEHGRVRQSGSRMVAIDIDVVVYDGVVLKPRDYGETFFTIGFREIG